MCFSNNIIEDGSTLSIACIIGRTTFKDLRYKTRQQLISLNNEIGNFEMVQKLLDYDILFQVLDDTRQTGKILPLQPNENLLVLDKEIRDDVAILATLVTRENSCKPIASPPGM